MISTFDTRGKALIAVSVAAAVAFYVMRSADPMPLALIVLKGAGVDTLALLALLYGPGRNGALLAIIMALGALGDMLIEIDVIAGAAAFLIGHLFAVVLYLGFRRDRLTTSQIALALVILVTIPFAGWSLPAERASAPMVTVYALALGLMAAAAWTSRFSRYSVGIGAVLFVLSDLLIFAKGGPLAESALPHLLIWPLYYAGQLMICLGVLSLLRRESVR
ncbi:MAG: lysoplasmalogenase family protein [Novosphingobium sp.]